MKPILAALLAAAAAASGCYRYTAVPTGYRPAVGEDVRVRLSERAFAGLAEEVRGDGAGSVVVGQIVEVEPQTMVLAVPVGSAPGAPRQVRREVRQRVVVPVADVVAVDLRQLDRRRTFLIAGGAIVLVGAVAVSELLEGFGGSTRPPGGPDPPELAGPRGSSW